ncbi:MAG: lytic transglycosylase domain-containing protein [Betaproteobacteria bacterium]|nr:lytic transglycosylase domain-containing protein [Betaproteobacteria bacterium]
MQQRLLKRIIDITRAALAAGLLTVATAALPSSPDDDFLAAREAFRVGDVARLDSQAGRLRGHVLEPYLAYWQLRLRLEDAEPAAVRDFLHSYAGTLLADQMRGQWLKVLGKQGAWELFNEEYPELYQEDPELTCYALQARFFGQQDGEALYEVRRPWFTGREAPESCGPLFDALVSGGLVNDEDVWARIRLALEAGQVQVAKRANRYLPDRQALSERLLDAVYDNPRRYLEKRRPDLGSRAGKELALFALQRVARSSTDQAHLLFTRIRDQLSEADQGYFLAGLAYQAARRHQPEAVKWYQEAAALTPLSDEQLAWRVRTGLRTKNWNEVAAAVDAMSEREQRVPAWRYWKARALRELGRAAEADALLAPLSTEHHFYGQLAAEDLGQATSVPAAGYKPGPGEIRAVQQLPGVRRALALYRLDLRTEGTREWVWVIRGFDDRQLLAAAEVARRNQLWDRAINTADKTLQLHDFGLRFLAPYREVLRDQARELGLDEAWVYGLIRQESRFVSDAKSSAGAQGLMQLMPATARWVARKLGMQRYRKSLASQVDVNVALGTWYLKHVLTSLDNQPVLASAAYNAGPVRARQWRAARPMEGAIYAETIPFNETRDYVKKVMSNATYYASAFGQQLESLTARMGTILPGVADEPALEEER